jgi:dCTP deaminase
MSVAVLTGTAIGERIKAGNIQVDPFDESLINYDGVSIDVRLGDNILVAKQHCPTPIVPGQDCSDRFTELLRMVGCGWILKPGFFYLATTFEMIGSSAYRPILHGKSTVARCGVAIHQAGICEPFFFGQITLEVTAAIEVMVRPGMRIGQVEFHTVEGEIVPYKGRYNGQSGPTPARREKVK